MGTKKSETSVGGSGLKALRSAKENRSWLSGHYRVGRPDRIFVDATVTVNADYGGVEGIACDVSETGMKVAVEKPLGPGPVRVKLVGLPIVSGEIRWSLEHHMGIELKSPFTPELLAEWIARHGNRRKPARSASRNPISE
jgi:hypothetical protein